VIIFLILTMFLGCRKRLQLIQEKVILIDEIKEKIKILPEPIPKKLNDDGEIKEEESEDYVYMIKKEENAMITIMAIASIVIVGTGIFLFLMCGCVPM